VPELLGSSQLFDVGPVTFPACTATDTHVACLQSPDDECVLSPRQRRKQEDDVRHARVAALKRKQDDARSAKFEALKREQCAVPCKRPSGSRADRTQATRDWLASRGVFGMSDALTLKDLNAVLREVAKLPDEMIEALQGTRPADRDGGGRIRHGTPAMPADARELAWGPFSFIEESHSRSESVGPSAPASLVAHEMGHAYDAAIGYPSEAGEWQALHKAAIWAQAGGLHSNSHHVTSASERWAESL